MRIFIINSQGLDAHVIGSDIQMFADSRHDLFDITPQNDGVDQSIAQKVPMSIPCAMGRQ